jgi:uncharacterized coiled-coil DUF342 family protein
MNKTSKTNGTENKQVAVKLAKINEQIATLQQQRAGLAEPLKLHYAELRKQLADTETQIRDLDGDWKPEPMKAKAVTKITEILTAHGAPMTEAEILKEIGSLFTPWKTRNTLKKKSQGAKAVFAVKDGKYTVKA